VWPLNVGDNILELYIQEVFCRISCRLVAKWTSILRVAVVVKPLQLSSAFDDVACY